MKRLIKTGLSLMILSAFVFAPIASFAQINTNLTGETEANLNGSVDASADVKMDSETSVDADSKMDSETNMNTQVDSNSEVDADYDVNANNTNSFRVNSLGVAVTSSAQVNNDSDLEVFSENVSVKEKDIEKVEIEAKDETESKVEVVYKHKGKFLGFIPVTVKSKTIVEVKSDSTVEVKTKMPWWSFLVANKNYAKAELESRIKNNPTVKANANANVSAQSKARIAEAVIAEIKANAELSSEASLNS